MINLIESFFFFKKFSEKFKKIQKMEVTKNENFKFSYENVHTLKINLPPSGRSTILWNSPAGPPQEPPMGYKLNLSKKILSTPPLVR